MFHNQKFLCTSLQTSNQCQKSEPNIHHTQWRIQGGLSGQAPPNAPSALAIVWPLGGRKEMIEKDETGVKTPKKDNQEENWAEIQFMKENLFPLAPRW